MLASIYVARKPDVYEASSRVQVDLENNPMYAGKNHPLHLQPGKRSRLLQHATANPYQSWSVAPSRKNPGSGTQSGISQTSISATAFYLEDDHANVGRARPG